MSVRVNLLPREALDRARARRLVFFSGVALVGWVVVLAAIYLVLVDAVNDARDIVEAEELEVARLEAELERLQPFAELAAALEARNKLLAAAMVEEVSWVRVLNDVAVTFPGSSSLRSLDAAVAGGPEADGADDEPAALVGRVRVTGYSVERYAPGLELLLLQTGQAATLTDAYLETAEREEIGTDEVTAFEGRARIEAEAYSGRYRDGLPDGGVAP